MSATVDTTAVDQGKRKRSLKTASEQGSKRVKSTHHVQDETQQQPGQEKKKSRRRGGQQHKKNRNVSVTVSVPVSAPAAKGLWTLRQPSGGRYIAHDPVVTPDDSYVFASNGRDVQVLSVATSLVERRLPAKSHTVTAFALSSQDPEQIHIASHRTLQTWDWITGTAVGDAVDYHGKIHAVCSGDALGHGPEILYTICQADAEYRIMAANRVIYTSRDALSHLSLEGDYILAASPSTIIVGRRSPSAAESVDNARFTFVEITSPLKITCLAGRVEDIQGLKKKGGPSDMLTVAAGNVEGQIMVYEDVFAAARPAGLSLMPRTLHWHREAVASLKWSKDGNYIISGGRETTLVLWQLSTGKSQFLPHLTAEIERLTVSPSGTSYAIQLADNSVMLLSTTELKPIANFAHLQAQTVLGQDIKKEVKPAAAALHPAHNDHLFIAVPPSASVSSRPFLQTYDITNDRHVSRQALTRNNVTDFNKGPEGNKINVPDVPFLKLSEDGQWLATIEEWCPPSTDLDYLASESDNDMTASRREVYLKIWQWDAEKSQWTLETRIDNPHQIDQGAQPARVLALISDPAENGFATIGEDSCVRIWKPKTRLRNGLVVRGANSEGLVDWSCRHTVQLSHKVDLSDEDEHISTTSTRPIHATIAYSADASILTASQTFAHSSIPATISFINASTGSIEQTRSNLYTGTLRALDFLDRHLILVSDTSLHVWDVVSETLSYRTQLSAPSDASTLLAVSPEDHTFAVVVATARKSWIKVWSTAHATPECALDVNKAVAGLLSTRGRKGYTLVTAAAEVQLLVPRTAVARLGAAASTAAETGAAKTADAKDEAVTEEMDVDGDGEALLVDEGEDGDGADDDDDNDDEEPDKPVVRPEELARVFDNHNVALMPVRDMFEAVVGLYARRKARVGVV